MKVFFQATLLFCLKMALLSSLLTFWGFFVSRTEQGSSSRNRRNCKYAGGSPPLQPTVAAQLLLDGVKIEPCTIIIMVSHLISNYSSCEQLKS
jgi:hypothetical protein